MTHRPNSPPTASWRTQMAAACLLAVAALPTQAAVTGYTSQATFNAAITGMGSITTNFDAIPTGTSYTAGTGPAGSGFILNLSGPSAVATNLPTVGGTFWTTSGNRYLGLNNPDTALQAGDSLTFNFGTAVHAFGLYAVGGGDVLGGDLQISAGADAVSNSATADATDDAGSFAYFLGLVSDDAAFNSVTFDFPTWDQSFLLPITLDDITLAVRLINVDPNPVPEPASLALFGAALAAWGLARRKRHH